MKKQTLSTFDAICVNVITFRMVIYNGYFKVYKTLPCHIFVVVINWIFEPLELLHLIPLISPLIAKTPLLSQYKLCFVIMFPTQ